MMLHLQIDPRSAVPAYRQIMDQLKYYVASGTLHPGDQIPSIRECARYLGVNPTTIVKAYSELEHEGVIDRRQGKGAFVAETGPVLSSSELEKTLRTLVRQLCVEARQMGAAPDQILRMVQEETMALAMENVSSHRITEGE